MLNSKKVEDWYQNKNKMEVKKGALHFSFKIPFSICTISKDDPLK